MSIAKRPFSDPRNTYIVGNNDPGAFDKSFAGRPGTHAEQRCCGDRAPYEDWEIRQTGYYVDDQGQRVAHILTYWARPENREAAKDGWWNAPTPPGWVVETAPVPGSMVLWCHGCKTGLEEFGETLTYSLEQVTPVLRGIAIALSYIPVLGTAVSFVLNTALNIAEGGSLDDAALDAIGRSLPGQPLSGSTFSAVRAMIKGDRIDEIAIEALPISPAFKATIKTAISITEAIARGDTISEIALAQIYIELPAEGKKVVDIARRLASGERLGDVALLELPILVRRKGEEYVAAVKAAALTAAREGQDAVRKFLAETGYQGALESLPTELRNAFTAGILAGQIERIQQRSFSTEELDKPSNDRYAQRGRVIIASGATWMNAAGRQVPLSEIRNGSTWRMTVRVFDPLSGQTVNRVETYVIDEPWRRGFDVALGSSEGKTVDDPGQQAVRASLVVMPAMRGFDVGQAIQHARTRTAMTLVSVASPESSQGTSRLITAIAPSRSAAAAYGSAMVTPQDAVTPSAFAPRPVVLDPSRGLPVLTVLPAPGEPVPVPPNRVIDPALRVALANRGIALSSRDAVIRADREAQPSDATKRGFGIATALLEDQTDLGTRDQEIQRVRLSLDPETLSGFDHGVAAFHQRRQSSPESETFFAPERTSFVAQASQAGQKHAQRAAWVTYYVTQAAQAAQAAQAGRAGS